METGETGETDETGEVREYCRVQSSSTAGKQISKFIFFTHIYVKQIVDCRVVEKM